jgi:hypothetical protein
MKVLSGYTNIRPTRRSILQGGLAWLLHQKPVKKRLSKMISITNKGREASFDVKGQIAFPNRRRTISISPVTSGTIFSTRHSSSSFPLPHPHGDLSTFDFTIVDAHSHPNHGEPLLTSFSSSDLSLFLLPDNIGFPHPLILLLLETLDLPVSGFQSVFLTFIQKDTGFNPMEVKGFREFTFGPDAVTNALTSYRDLGLKATIVSFTHCKKTSRSIDSISHIRNRDLFREFNIWVNEQALAASPCNLDRDSVWEDLETPPPSAVPPAIIVGCENPGLSVELTQRNLFPCGDILSDLGIDSKLSKKLTASIEAAVKEGKIKPDFRYASLGFRQEVYFWSPDNPLFQPFRQVVDMLSADELKEQVDDLPPPDITINIPDGKQFHFYRPSTVQGLQAGRQAKRVKANSDFFLDSLLDKLGKALKI